MGNVFSKEKLIGGRVLAEAVFRGGTRVHQRLSNHRKASIHCRCLVDVKYEVGILDEIHPKSQWKTKKKKKELY